MMEYISLSTSYQSPRIKMFDEIKEIFTDFELGLTVNTQFAGQNVLFLSVLF